jgi:DNA invertase Pin-like site-specific DNA recombinase
MMLGYQRTIDGDGTLEVQRLALASIGYDLVFEDLGMSGIQPSRPGLSQLLEAIQPDDVLIVWRLDRLARDFTDVLEVLTQVLVAGVRVISLQDDFDSDRLGSDELMRVVKAFMSHKGDIEAERALGERRRRPEALRGPGRPGTVSDAQWADAKSRFEAGEKSVGKVAGQVGVSRQALYRKLDAERVSH